jgi:hypothetical protein
MTGPAMTGPAMTGPAMTGPAMTGPARVGSTPTMISVRTATAPVNARASDFWCTLVADRLRRL